MKLTMQPSQASVPCITHSLQSMLIAESKVLVFMGASIPRGCDQNSEDSPSFDPASTSWWYPGAMSTFVLLLRGVNVGGQNKLPMATLRHELSSAGYGNVRTYLQSGNAVIDLPAPGKPRTPAEVADEVEALIESRFAFSVPVLVRSASQMAAVATRHPFGDRASEPNRQLHVAFLHQKPTKTAVAKLDPHRADPEELLVDGSEIYMWCPTGLGRSKLLTGAERTLGVEMTVRNWRTVTALADMAGA